MAKKDEDSKFVFGELVEVKISEMVKDKELVEDLVELYNLAASAV